MAEPFDPARDLADAPRARGRQATKDAATLILTRRHDRPEVLMGRRAPGHVFMASRWVFPGGRIERADHTAKAADDLSAATAQALAGEMPERRARALALTAIRETYEETGLMLATPAPPASVAGPWREFRAAGALPTLQPLDYIARAVTPPGRTRRFDARFFMAPADALLSPDPTAGSGELDEIAWLSIEDALALDPPAITRFVLGEVADRLVGKTPARPFVRMVRGRHVVERA